MKAICAGTRTSRDVVHESLEKYREVYVRSVTQIEVLKAVSIASYSSAFVVSVGVCWFSFV